MHGLMREGRQRLLSTLPDYGRRVAQGLALDVSEVERLAKLTQEERAKATL